MIKAVDMFCGAGGTSSGLFKACMAAGETLRLIAINHWPKAIATHRANHPTAHHICASVDSLNPWEIVPDRRLDVLVASPECTHHSVARGGRPVNDQFRASAWQVLRWVEMLTIDHVTVENVGEFTNWGPIGVNGRPSKSRKGETYRAFLSAFRSLGYSVEDRILNCADYGDPTSRRRLFILAKKGNKKITWPEPTHGDNPLFGTLKPYRTAREIIDWEHPTRSIFSRKRPLAPTTIRRIAAGLRKYGGKNAEPFLVMLYGTNDVRSVNRPLPTVTASGNHIGLCQPFLCKVNHGGPGDRNHDLDRPFPTLTTKNGLGLVQPFIIPIDHRGSGKDYAQSIETPLRTITTKSRFALCEPFLIPFFREREGQEPRTHSLDEPLPTVTSHGAGALVEPFLVQYNGRSEVQSIDEPLNTITTKDRFALIEIKGDRYALDICFRMLTPMELAQAMSFEKSYLFEGNVADQVKQIGNAVPVNTAMSLLLAHVDKLRKRVSVAAA